MRSLTTATLSSVCTRIATRCNGTVFASTANLGLLLDLRRTKPFDAMGHSVAVRGRCGLSFLVRRQAKIFDGVLVTDSADHVTHKLLIIGKFAFFHFIAKQIAQHAAEVFMPRIRHEGPRIRDHTYKARQK